MADNIPKWEDLSMKEKSDLMKAAVDNGYTDLAAIRNVYNNMNERPASNDDDLVDMIIKEEGFTSKPVDIGDGKKTLGSGLTSPRWHEQYRKNGNRWSDEDNRKAVAEEVRMIREDSERNIPNWDTFPDKAQKALISYKYNYNYTRGNSPKMFAAFDSGDLHEIANQIDAVGKNPKFIEGLKKRRERERNLFLEGITEGNPLIFKPKSDPFNIQTLKNDRTRISNPYVYNAKHTVKRPNPDEFGYRIPDNLSLKQKYEDRMKAEKDSIDRVNAVNALLDINNLLTPFKPLKK